VAALVFAQAVAEEPMTIALFTLGGIALIALTIAWLDWFGRRKDRRSEHRTAA